MPDLSVAEHIERIRSEGALLAAAVAAGDLDGVVPTCPDWTLRELTHHVGRVHHWAAAHVEQARATPLSDEESESEWGPMPADADVVSWYRAANARLVAALAGAPADLACWSFLPAPSPLAFWARRQAHETAIHRVDAQWCLGSVTAVDATFAVDGIDELLFGFYGRPGGRLRSQTPRTLAINTEADRWIVHIGPDGPRAERVEPAERSAGPAGCTIDGPVGDVYLALWNRRPFTDLMVEGDPAVLELWAGKATVRWS